MRKKDEAMKLALEALEFIPQSGSMLGSQAETKRLQAIAVMKEALVNEALDKMAENARELGLDYEPAQQEPVEWLTGCPECGMDGGCDCDSGTWNPPAQQEPVGKVNELFDEAVIEQCGFNRELLVYTSPQPSKPWVGLTQQDIDIAFDDTQEGGGFNEFARAIEAKLREKNT